MNYDVRDGQSLVDVALRICGAAEGVWVLAERNGLSVTDRLEVGAVIEYEGEDVVERRVAEKYAQEGIWPAAEVSGVRLDALCGRVEEEPKDEPGTWDTEGEGDYVGALMFSEEFDITFR